MLILCQVIHKIEGECTRTQLGPSGGIYHPNFVPCFVYHQLNTFKGILKVAFFQKVQWNFFRSPNLKKKIPKNYHGLVFWNIYIFLRFGDLKNESHFLKKSHLYLGKTKGCWCYSRKMRKMEIISLRQRPLPSLPSS